VEDPGRRRTMKINLARLHLTQSALAGQYEIDGDLVAADQLRAYTQTKKGVSMRKILALLLILAVVVVPLVGCDDGEDCDTSSLEQKISSLESQLASATPEVQELVKTVEVPVEKETVREVSTGISQEDYDKVIADFETAQSEATKVSGLESQIATLTTENAKLEAKISTLIAENDRLDTLIASLLTPAPNTIEVVSITYKVTEKNNSWWRYSWQLTVRNTTPMQHVFDGEVKFLDSGGFELDYSRIYDAVVGPDSEVTITESDLIDIDVAPAVASVVAKVSLN
jgi:hypothetical protein